MKKMRRAARGRHNCFRANPAPGGLTRKMKPASTSLLILVALTASFSGRSEVRLSGIFSDHMVVQRGQPVTVWGWADGGEEITVHFAEQTVVTTTAGGGSWHVALAPMEGNSKGRDLVVRSRENLVSVHDVLVGDIWHASGQSNMAMRMGAVAGRLERAEEDIVNAKHPLIRFRRINRSESEKTLDDLPVNRGWVVCSPNAVPQFSAVAYYFAHALRRELGVPIGMIDSSRGGTPIEPFIPREAFASHPTLQRELELGDQEDLSGIGSLPGGVRARDANWLPGRLFNSRLAPISRFAVRGAIWYQGESNCGDREDPRDYQHKMRALINGWRSSFCDETLPVYFVQLPGSGAGPAWPYLREQQRLSFDLPHSGMVVTIDLLDGNIHPPNKVDVGARLALWALGGEYGRENSTSGPLFESAAHDNNGTFTISFKHAENGLMIARKTGLAEPKQEPGLELMHFELADANGRWYPATAVIRGDQVIVKREDLSEPIAVRYAYAVDPQYCHLYNREGLPASPFCSNPDLLDYVP